MPIEEVYSEYLILMNPLRGNRLGSVGGGAYSESTRGWGDYKGCPSGPQKNNSLVGKD